MSTVAQRIANVPNVTLVASGIDAIRQEAAQVRVDDEWGRSESLDPDNVGDIADEGAGHRG